MAEVHCKLRSRFLGEAARATQSGNAFQSNASAYEESAGAYLGRVDGYTLASDCDSSKVDQTGIDLEVLAVERGSIDDFKLESASPLHDMQLGIDDAPSEIKIEDTCAPFGIKTESKDDLKPGSVASPDDMRPGIDLTPSEIKHKDTRAPIGDKLESTITPPDIPCDSTSIDGSCSSHETASIRDDDSYNEAVIRTHGQDPRATLVDRLMIVFTSRFYIGLEQFLSAHAAIQLRPDAGSSCLGSSAQGTGSSGSPGGRSGDYSSQTSIGSGASRKHVRKSDRDTGDNQDDDDDEDNRKRKRGKSRSADTGDMAQRKLACPFFKRRPATYMSRRSCPGPGWQSVHRLK